MSDVTKAVVDAVIADSFLTDPNSLVASLRAPAGRNPAESSRAVAGAIAKLSDQEAVALVRSVLDAAIFGVFNLLDQDFKNHGPHARFSLGKDGIETTDRRCLFHEVYRHSVDPNGLLTAESGQ